MEGLDKQNEIDKAKVSEDLFEKWLQNKGIKYKRVTDDPNYRILGYDYITYVNILDSFWGIETIKEITYDVKDTYKDNGDLIFEVYDNINADKRNIWYGWMYYSKANYLVFLDRKNKVIIRLKFNDKFKKWFENQLPEWQEYRNEWQGENVKEIKEPNWKYSITKNKTGPDQNYQSAYVRIPISDIPEEFIYGVGNGFDDKHKWIR